MNNLDLLIPSVRDSTKDYWTWATVIETTPLKIRLDGDETPLDITPDSLLENPTEGQRVYVQRTGRRTIVHGGSINGGGVAPAPALHGNPSFEKPGSTPDGNSWIDDWTRFWMGAETLMEWDTTSYIEGTKSVKISMQPNGNGRLQSNTVFSVVPFSVVTLSVWAKANATTTCEIGLLTDTSSQPNFYNGSPNLAWHNPAVTIGTTWQKFTVQMVVPANHRYARISLNPYHSTQARTVWFDATSSSMDSSDLDSGWIGAPLNPGWSNYGSGHQTVRYRRRDGIVYLQGLVIGSSRPSGDTIFTLPAGYRPAGDGKLLFNAIEAGNTAGRIDINADGRVEYQFGHQGWLSLAGIQFPADQ